RRPITGPDPGLFADITGISKVQLLLADDAGIMLAVLKSAGARIRNHVIAVSCVKLLSAHNSTQHTSRKHKV
ncbi:hypothetical protein ACQZFR_18865, partial [Alcaligenes nematophilus]|uniref:hypothetical protein n=1 Tax=Alcaligenes nematophilus TaxID=2994643 RepID=UPI003D23C5F5